MKIRDNSQKFKADFPKKILEKSIEILKKKESPEIIERIHHKLWGQFLRSSGGNFLRILRSTLQEFLVLFHRTSWNTSLEMIGRTSEEFWGDFFKNFWKTSLKILLRLHQEFLEEFSRNSSRILGRIFRNS